MKKNVFQVEYCSQEDIQKVMKSQNFNINHRVWFKTIYSFGISIREMIEIKVGDINFERGTIKIDEGPKKRLRILDIPRALNNDLRKKTYGKKPEDYLFTGRKGKLHRRTVQKALENIKLKLGFSFCLQILKKSLACHLYEVGWDEKSIATHLGYSTVRATRKFLSSFHPNTRKAHPLDKLLGIDS